jgi:hypothetical protein|eukprot:COSAG01_NODE_77_length_28297_cov_104.096230_25_plen_103_part_00
MPVLCRHTTGAVSGLTRVSGWALGAREQEWRRLPYGIGTTADGPRGSGGGVWPAGGVGWRWCVLPVRRHRLRQVAVGAGGAVAGAAIWGERNSRAARGGVVS